MWSNSKHENTAPSSKKPAPTRQPSMKLNNLGPGSVLTFAGSCTLPQLAGARATIIQVRTYRFGDDIQINYGMDVGGDTRFSMTVAEDDQGFYLAISRELNAKEQDQWFGRDALSFFCEPSTAKTIRCKVEMGREGDWAAAKYTKTVDWVDGSVLLGRMSTASMGRQVKQFHYNLLVNESGDRALEIEHEDASGENRVMVTVYRPASDIEGIAEPMPHVPVPQTPVKAEAPKPVVAPVIKEEEPLVLDQEEVPLFTAANDASPPRANDFRRLSTPVQPRETIHVAREEMRAQPAMDAIISEGLPPLPSFLTSREGSYLSLDAVIPPETDRVRCDLRSAKVMIDMAVARNVRVRDVMREMVGLDANLNDEVIFELPLTDEDFRKLAMRYRLRPDHRDEIRARLQDELTQRLIGIAKR